MSALEDRLYRFAYEWHEAMNSPYAVNMMPLLLKAASDVRNLAAPSLEAENSKLRELVRAYDSALNRLCDQMQGHIECSKCVLGRRFDEDTCALDELRKASLKLGIEVDE